jgi:hypothetical protein
MFDRLAPSSPERDHLAPILSYYYSNSEAVDVDEWRKRVCRFGEWGTDFDMVVFACLFKINVMSYSQVTAERILENAGFNTTQRLEFMFERDGPLMCEKTGIPLYLVDDFIPAYAETIFIFNHHCTAPTKPVPPIPSPPKKPIRGFNNHFGYLEPCEDVQGKAPVYYGGIAWTDPSPDTPSPFKDVEEVLFMQDKSNTLYCSSDSDIDDDEKEPLYESKSTRSQIYTNTDEDEMEPSYMSKSMRSMIDI